MRIRLPSTSHLSSLGNMPQVTDARNNENHSPGSGISGGPRASASSGSSRQFARQRCLNPITGEIEPMIGEIRGKDRLLVNLDGEKVEMIKIPLHGAERESLYVPLEKTRTRGGMDSQELGGLSIDESSFAEVERKIRGKIERRFEQDAKAVKIGGDGALLGAEHKCVGLVLHYAGRTLEEEGIAFTDPHVNNALRTAVASAIDLAEEWDRKEMFNVRSCVVHEALRGHMSSAKPHKTLELLLSTNFDGTPFGRIKPDKRSFMCVDPCKLNELEQVLGDLDKAWGAQRSPGKSVLTPFMGLLFNKQSNYLDNMVKGWKMVMDALNDPAIDAGPDFVIRLHEVAAAGTASAGKAGVETNFPLIPGVNMTSDGQREMRRFIDSLRQDHGIPISFEVAYMEQGKRIYKLKRDEVPEETVKALMSTWRDEYKTAISAANDKTGSEKSDAKVLAAIDFCQKLERFHVFKDGNCRVSAVLLLNYLLAKEGEPLTALDNPNKIDGFSREEMLQLVREGQARVRAMEQ